MQGIRRAIVVFLVGSCLFILFGHSRAWADAPKQTADQAEAGFTGDLNGERTSRGLGALNVASDLVAYARQHSADMAAAGRPYHDPNVTSNVQNWQVMGDNVGSGPDEVHIHQGFMNSKVHRDEILEPRYTEVGVGCVWAGNVLYVTEVFRMPMKSTAAAAHSPAAAPAAPAAPRTKVVTRTVTPATAAAPRPSATAPALPAAVPSTTTTVTPKVPVTEWPTAATVLAAQRASSSHSPTRSPLTFAAVIAALALMVVAGAQVAALKRPTARA